MARGDQKEGGCDEKRRAGASRLIKINIHSERLTPLHQSGRAEVPISSYEFGDATKEHENTDGRERGDGQTFLWEILCGKYRCRSQD